MRLLLDTNIFLEIILEQARAEEAQELLSKIEHHKFFITDFSLHSIGLFLFRCNRHSVFRQFMKDMFLNADIPVIALSPQEMENVIASSQKFKLDFDDAYQYAIAERFNLTIVSFDADFDRTEIGGKTPAQIIK